MHYKGGMSDMAQRKAALRKEMLALRAALAPERAAQNSLAVTGLVRDIPRWRSAAEVLAYWPAKNELDTRPLIAGLWGRGARVLLPRCRPDQPGIADLAGVSCEADLAPGAFSIMEPGPACAVTADAAPDVILVPGLAFDRQGRRLGFGGGYYDRLLALPNLARALKIGLAHGFQVRDELPAESWDLPVDAVCSEEGLLWFV
jgi:5-formyltetrahydrofolate cyclo-ligase